MKKVLFGIESKTGFLAWRITRYRLIGSLIILFACISCTSLTSKEQIIPFIVSIEPDDSIRYDYFILECRQIKEFAGEIDLDGSEIRIHDLNNDNILVPQLINTNRDNEPDFIKVKTTIQRNEPIRPFELIISIRKSKTTERVDSFVANTGTIRVNYLRNYPDYSLSNNLDGIWAETISGSFVNTYPDPSKLEIFEPGEWTYTNGFFTNGLCYYDELTGSNNHLAYVQQWLDLFVNEKGEIDPGKYSKERYRLDDVLPGRSLLYVYEKTGNTKYLKAAEILVDQLKNQPRTSAGGYWHKKVYDWQMWLDGIYMADVFMMQYAEITGHPEDIDDAIFQMKLIYKNTSDSATGLLAHGWDESRSKIWADPVSGKSPEFWGRGMGWYCMALTDALDYIPDNHPQRGEVLDILKNISAALIKYQDKETGLWYQVLDKSSQKGNWPETSCTAMFAYAFLKAYKMGYLPEEYQLSAKKAFEGLKKHFVYFDNDGRIYLTGTVKVGTLNEEVSNGSYDYYISVDRRVNDFKGVGALLYLAIVEEHLNMQKKENNEK